MKGRWPCVSLALLVFAVFLPAGSATAQDAAVAESVLDSLPSGSGVFLENQGQWPPAALFAAHRGELGIAIEPSTVLLSRTVLLEDERVEHDVVTLILEGPQRAAPVGESLRADRHNFLIGNDPAQWTTGVRAYDQVRVSAGVGADLVVGWNGASPELAWRLAPGSALSELVIRCEGIDSLSMDQGGSLVVSSEQGSLRHLAPRISERTPEGALRELEGAFRILGPDRFGFTVAGRNPARELIIVQGLEWSTFLGGATGAIVQCLGLTADEGVTVCGRTGAGFPTTPGAFDQTFHGGSGSIVVDLYVAHLDPTGSQLVWATYLGGSIKETAERMLIAADGSAIIAGYTSSPDWPVTAGAYQEIKPGIGSVGFVTSLAANGSALNFSTFFGGTVSTRIFEMTRDSAGNLLIAGGTQSLDLPVTPNAVQMVGFGFPDDAFLAVLNQDGSDLLYSTYLAGSSGDAASGLAVTEDGLVYIGGGTNSDDFPVTPGAYDTEFTGFSGPDVFVSCIDLNTGSLVASTLLGGDTIDALVDLAMDPSGLVVVLGYTRGFNPPLPTEIFPTTPDAFDPTYNGDEDFFLSKFDPALTTLVYSTFIGGDDRDYAHGMAVEASGAVVVIGDAVSADFPTTEGCFQAHKSNPLSNNPDLVVFRLAPDGRSLHYSTYLGGSQKEGLGVSGWADLAVMSSGAVTVGSSSSSHDFPTTPGSYDPTKLEGTPADAVIARLSLLPAGAGVFGDSTAGCTGPMTIGVTSLPKIGNTRFGLTCSGVPAPGSMGWLAVSAAPAVTPMMAGGAQLLLDPTVLLLLPVMPLQPGYAEVNVAIPEDPRLIGDSLSLQFFWQNACGPTALSASNGLTLVVQP